MNFRLIFAIVASKIALIFCKLINRSGTNFPGKVALKIYPDILTQLSKNYKTIVITGTNGKTTTVRVIGSILAENGIEYISNKSGANLMGGIVTTFIKASDIYGHSKINISLIEVDEGVFYKACNFMKPDILVVTNFFRDQLDRYGELHNTVKNISCGIQKLENVKLVLNADDSLCASLGRDTNKETVYYGVSQEAFQDDQELINSDATLCLYCNSRYSYNYRTYGHLGDFVCQECGYTRPTPQVSCTEIYELNNSNSIIQFSFQNANDYQENVKTEVNLPGIYNIYNTLAGAACGYALGLQPCNIVKSLSNIESGFGRMETIFAEGKNIALILVKNPIGFNQVLNLLKPEDEMQISFVINDLPGDGADVSWIWDVDFEKIQNIQNSILNIYTSGTRAEDINVRLKYSGIFNDKISIIKNYNELIETGLSRTTENGTFYIYSSYTAMLDIRKYLEKKYNLKEF
jgi:UDP-N-acetylmuramyl tripeptide synthase